MKFSTPLSSCGPRLAFSLLVASVCGPVSAQELANTSPGAGDAVTERVIVTGRADSLIGIAGSAAEGTVGQEELAQRPILRPGVATGCMDITEALRQLLPGSLPFVEQDGDRTVA